MRGNKTVLFCFSLPQNCRFYVPFFQRQIHLVNNFQQSLIFLKKLMTDSLHQYLLDTGIQMLQCKIQFLTWIYTLDASIQQLQKIRQLDRVYYNKTMWPKWKQEPDSQNRRQECNANLNTQEKKNHKSFKPIMLRANQACTGCNENAIRPTWATEQERETASRRPLLEHSPHHRPLERDGSAGMSSSACVWLHTNTTSWHSKQQSSWCWVLLLTHVHLACFLFYSISALQLPPLNQPSCVQPLQPCPK